MKKYFLLILLFLSLTSFAQVKIFGELKSATSSPIFLMENIGGIYQKIDSCKIVNGIYTFERDLNTGYYSLGLNINNYAQIIVQEDEKDVEINFLTEDFKQSIQVIQSEENKLLWQFMRARKKMKSSISQVFIAKTYFPENSIEYIAFQRQEDSLKQQYNEFLMSTYQAYHETFFAKTIISDIEISDDEDFFDYTLFIEPDLIRSGVFTRKITEFLQFHTAYTEDGFISSIDWILQKALDNQEVYEFVLNYLLELFNQVGPDVVLDYLVEEYVISDGCSDLPISEILEVKLNAYKKLQIGNIAPNVSMFNSEGTLCNLNDLYSFSRINVLFFGSSMCHFCQEAKPLIEDISLEEDLIDLQIIYISLDTNRQTWLKEAEAKPANWVYLSELKAWDSKSTEIFQIHKTPSFYIIDGTSQIISKPKDVFELMSELELLKN